MVPVVCLRFDEYWSFSEKWSTALNKSDFFFFLQNFKMYNNPLES